MPRITTTLPASLDIHTRMTDTTRDNLRNCFDKLVQQNSEITNTQSASSVSVSCGTLTTHTATKHATELAQDKTHTGHTKTVYHPRLPRPISSFLQWTVLFYVCSRWLLHINATDNGTWMIEIDNETNHCENDKSIICDTDNDTFMVRMTVIDIRFISEIFDDTWSINGREWHNYMRLLLKLYMAENYAIVED